MNGSHTSDYLTSTTSPVNPSTPQSDSSSNLVPYYSILFHIVLCLALNSVTVLITLTPQFSINVLGITSNAYAKANLGHYATPYSEAAVLAREVATAISVAPPPGNNLGSIIIFLATHIASYKFLSISFNTSLDAPLNTIVQALGSVQ